MDNIRKILGFAMRMEKDAGDFYSYYIDRVESPSTKELFTKLSEMEKQHYKVIKSRFDELGFEEPPISISWVVDDNFTARDPHILADNSDLIENSENEASDLGIIRMAYLIENDFALFYKNAANLVEEEKTKELLNDLAAWEDSHKEMFYRKYQALLKKHWSDIASIILP